MILSWKRGNLTMLKLDRKKIIAAIQDEISNFPKARYYHRLHVALYALKTGSCYKAASVYVGNNLKWPKKDNDYVPIPLDCI